MSKKHVKCKIWKDKEEWKEIKCKEFEENQNFNFKSRTLTTIALHFIFVIIKFLFLEVSKVNNATLFYKGLIWCLHSFACLLKFSFDLC